MDEWNELMNEIDLWMKLIDEWNELMIEMPG